MQVSTSLKAHKQSDNCPNVENPSRRHLHLILIWNFENDFTFALTTFSSVSSTLLTSVYL